jgi:hypothetical protein
LQGEFQPGDYVIHIHESLGAPLLAPLHRRQRPLTGNVVDDPMCLAIGWHLQVTPLTGSERFHAKLGTAFHSTAAETVHAPMFLADGTPECGLNSQYSQILSTCICESGYRGPHCSECAPSFNKVDNSCVFAAQPTPAIQGPVMPHVDPVFGHKASPSERAHLDAEGCHKFTCGCSAFDVFVHHRDAKSSQVVNMFDETMSLKSSMSPLSLIMSSSLNEFMQRQCQPIGQCVMPVDLAEPCFCPPTHSGRFCDKCADGYIDYPHCVPADSSASTSPNKQAKDSTATPSQEIKSTDTTRNPVSMITKSFTESGCHQYTCGCSNFDVFDRFDFFY